MIRPVAVVTPKYVLAQEKGTGRAAGFRVTDARALERNRRDELINRQRNYLRRLTNHNENTMSSPLRLAGPRKAQMQQVQKLRAQAAALPSGCEAQRRALAEIKALKNKLVTGGNDCFSDVAFLAWRREHSYREYRARLEADRPPVIDMMIDDEEEEDDDEDEDGKGRDEVQARALQGDFTPNTSNTTAALTTTAPPKKPNPANMQLSIQFVAAAGACDIVSMRNLLDKGCAVNCMDPCTGRGALHEAAANGHEKALRLLFERECDCNARTMLGRESALHVASRNGHYRACRLLLRRGCEVENLNGAGDAPIHLAGSIDVVNVLTTYGARPSMRNAHGKTAMDTIEDREIVRRIEEAQEEEFRKDFARQREKRKVFEAAQRAIWEKEKEKQAEDDKRRMKREYMAFRHDGAKKKKSKSVFGDQDDGLFEYERRIPRR